MACPNFHERTARIKLELTDFRYIGIQNGQTLKVLNLECVTISHYWQLQTLKDIIDNCVNLEEISFMSEKDNVPLIEDTITYLGPDHVILTGR